MTAGCNMSRVERLIKYFYMGVKNLGSRVIFAWIMTVYMQSGLIHTYPCLYLGKKKCAWEMTLLTFFKWYLNNLNLEFEKILLSHFWKNEIWSFLPYRAESDFRAKSLNKGPFKASDCQNATNMWFSIEDLRKKIPLFL